MTNMMLMSFKPILSYATVGDERDGEMHGVLHLVHHYLSHFLYFCLRHIEIQLVMYLHNHLRFQVLLFETPMDSDHGYLDDICRSALDRRIDGIAFGERT